MGDMGNMSASKVYASYAWKVEDQTQILSRLEEACRPYGIKLMRDKDEIKYRESIRAYMDELTSGDAIVLILSDAYFKSQYCMYELCEIYSKRKDFLNRVFPIVVKGTHFHKAKERIPYISHWEQEATALDAGLKSIKTGNMDDASLTEMKEYETFGRTIGKLMSVLADMNTLTQDIHVGSDFAAMLDAITGQVSCKNTGQDVFEQKIKSQVGQLLRGMKPEWQALRSGLSGHLSVGAENRDVPMMVEQLWKSDDPFAMISILRNATQDALDDVSYRDDGAAVVQRVWDTSTRILGYLMLCLVSREWSVIQQVADNPYHDVPLNKRVAIEIISASINQTAACLMSMTEPDLYGANSDACETFVPENGWQGEKTVMTIVECIHDKLYPDAIKEQRQQLMDKIRRDIEANKPYIHDLDFLNEAFRVAHERGENNHYLAVRRNNDGHPAQDVAVCHQLKRHLPALPVIRFGTAAEADMPVILHVNEGALAYRIADFLKLIEDYQ